MLIVEIDIAKYNHEASAIAPDGGLVRRSIRFANSQSGYDKFMVMIRYPSEFVVFGATLQVHT